jgi:chemotaxis protein histidine kinase CheA
MTTPETPAPAWPASVPPSSSIDGCLNEIDGRLATAGDLLGSFGREWPGAAIADACGHLTEAMRAAESVGLHQVASIAFEVQDLLHTIVESPRTADPAVIDAVLHGIDVMVCVTRDAARQRTGRPAAALDDAVEQVFGRIARLSQGAATAPEPATVTLQPMLTAIRAMAREICVEAGKQVDVRFTGWEVAVPASVAEAVADPLVSLIRNSIHVAIEPVFERLRARKSRVGSIDVSASLDRGCLVLEVRDDGAGVDMATIRQRAEAHGLVRGDAPLDPDVALTLILEPDAATRGSGDSLRDRIDALNGFIDVYGDEGGTRTVIRVPLPCEANGPFSWWQR